MGQGAWCWACGLSGDLGLTASIPPLRCANRWHAAATLALCVTWCLGMALHCAGYVAFPSLWVQLLGTLLTQRPFASRGASVPLYCMARAG